MAGETIIAITNTVLRIVWPAHAIMLPSVLAQWLVFAGSHGSMHPHPHPHPHPRQASAMVHTSRSFKAVAEAERGSSPDLSTMYNKGFARSPRSAPRSPTAKRKASVAGPVQVQIQYACSSYNDNHH